VATFSFIYLAKLSITEEKKRKEIGKNKIQIDMFKFMLIFILTKLEERGKGND